MTEKFLHSQITSWIKTTYGDVMFNTDASGLRLNAGQSKVLKDLRSGNGFPDITIYEKGAMGTALFLEVKIESPYKADGTLKKKDGFETQHQMHISLNKRGYYACFVWSLEMAQEIIKNHLGDR